MKNKYCVLEHIYAISQYSKARYEQELRKKNIPISSKHIRLFLILGDEQRGLKFNEISTALGLSKSTLSDIIAKYEENKLILRKECTEDRRNVYVVLTEKGRMCVHDILEIESEILKHLMVNLSQEEFQQLFSLLAKVHLDK